MHPPPARTREALEAGKAWEDAGAPTVTVCRAAEPQG